MPLRGDGVSFGAIDVGAGPHVVLLHGIGGDRLNFVPLITRLQGRRRVVAVDLPGHGDSHDVYDVHSIEEIGDLLAGLLRRAGVRGATIVGEGVGGALALAIGNRAVDVASRIVAVEADIGLPIAYRVALDAVGEAIGREGLPAYRALADRRIAETTAPAVREQILEAAGACSADGVRRLFAAWRAWDDLAALSAFKGRVLLVRGGTPVEGKDLRTASPRTRIVRVPGGHFVSREAPDALGMVVDRWVG
jgi:pimeloyl-ACP methyl ester carboxylesterase